MCRDEPEGPGAWWQMPQGGIDEDEDPATGRLARAVRGDGHSLRRSHRRDPGWYSYDLPPELAAKGLGRPLSRARSRSGSPCASRAETTRSRIIGSAGQKAEFDAWRWAGIDELLELIVPFKREVYSAGRPRIRDVGQAAGLKCASARLRTTRSPHASPVSRRIGRDI